MSKKNIDRSVESRVCFEHLENCGVITATRSDTTGIGTSAFSRSVAQLCLGPWNLMDRTSAALMIRSPIRGLHRCFRKVCLCSCYGLPMPEPEP